MTVNQDRKVFQPIAIGIQQQLLTASTISKTALYDSKFLEPSSYRRDEENCSNVLCSAVVDFVSIASRQWCSGKS